jgi:cellulose synthase/poly-beta-1,6-N-acetylglucosamine synthase-like glycosyltransferase
MDFLYTNGLTVLAWAIACVWVVTFAVVLNACRKRSPLRPMSDCPQQPELPILSVIVPARNESACIETCIRSLFRQDYPNLQVVAVNDRSTDDTGDILDRLALEFAGQLCVVHVSTLPTGWFGKTHALDLGMRSAVGTVVCFTDADCEFLAPSALRTAVVEMLRTNLDFFTIAAKYTMNSLRECVAVPCCAEAIFAWLRPERVSDPRWPDAFANGAFIMVRRAPFESIGGWGSVRTKISEDLELARVAKRAGLRLNVEQGEGFYQTGSYGSLRESWNGWSRIFKGSLTPAQLLITLARMFLMFALPFGAMLWGMGIALHSGSGEWLMHGAGLAFAISFSLRCILDVVVFRLVGAPTTTAVFAPLGRLFVMLTVTRALLSHAGLVRTHWRGTTFVAGRMILPEQAKAA